MENEFGGYDLKALTEMYEREFEEYKLLLINGKTWKEVQAKRKTLTQLTAAIHGNIRRSSNPPDAFKTRESPPQ
jgi:hypothetical protein